MDRQNKKCSCARKSVRRMNNAGTDKEEGKKSAGPLAKKEQPAEGCSRRNDKREESSRQKFPGTLYSYADDTVVNFIPGQTAKYI